MQTNFTPEQLKDPGIRRSNEILRSCVHCGFCTATCPTYLLLGDELDSPRGRIYLIKDMLENDRPADVRTVRHIDRCLSCLSCMTTCPSGVHYMHLVDHAREHIEKTYSRPLVDRFLRWSLARIIPYPSRFRIAMLVAKFARPIAFLIPDVRLKVMLEMSPRRIPPADGLDATRSFPAEGTRKARVALLTGCAQRALAPGINEATIRLLTRLGCEVVIAERAGCCGALTHHMGRTDESHAAASRNIEAWMKEDVADPLDAIIVNASGCGTTVKDYGHMFRNDRISGDAKRVADIAVDISEFLGRLDYPESKEKGIRVAYHSACSLQHGQKIRNLPKDLLKRAGFEVVEPADSHLCCGSAGTYNLLQPKISAKLGSRKASVLEATNPDVIATGNIGCIIQIGSRTVTPTVHTVELLDWAMGGSVPPALMRRSNAGSTP